MNPIRQLPPVLVNRIAAGEVIERPAAAVKELVENAIDAGASRIEVTLAEGGQSLIVVSDDGGGMSPEALMMAVERHCTSKLPDDDLMAIRTLGFRGEALPSIGAVARLEITSRPPGADAGWSLTVEGGVRGAPQPAAFTPGTRVSVRDLFYATPARLKFMKSARAERDQTVDAVRRLAMAHPAIGFVVIEDGRALLRLDAGGALDPGAQRRQRLEQAMGRDFAGNAVEIAVEREGYRLSGLAGLPTLNRPTAREQYLFVNGRPVRDKLLAGAVRGAYQDFLPGDRHPMVALFLDLPRGEVDVNVHPAKTEVRFRDAGLVRGLIVASLKRALAGAGHLASSTLGAGAIASLGRAAPGGYWGGGGLPAAGLAEAVRSAYAPGLDLGQGPSASAPAAPEPGQTDYPLGAARAQLHGTYIVAETRHGLVIVDQHAAHERLVYERLKSALAAGGVARQALLLPEIVELDDRLVRLVLEKSPDLAALGLVVEGFGPGCVLVREVPAMLGAGSVKGLVRDLADEIAELGEGFSLKEKLDHIAATMACHGSLRAGRALAPEEMNALLRQMEATPHSGQCNHGRPTYVELGFGEIERLFGRR